MAESHAYKISGVFHWSREATRPRGLAVSRLRGLAVSRSRATRKCHVLAVMSGECQVFFVYDVIRFVLKKLLRRHP